ncbi:hypothetical protein [Symbioplanes lichenis]|nr:hypothetical protein [Actinoplanes lichenis]
MAAAGAGIPFIACLRSGVRRLGDFDPRHVAAVIETFPDLPTAVDRLDRS